MFFLFAIYYYYLANKPSKKDATDKVVQNDELAYLVARNISDNYPESVRDVVKLYARITKEYYDSDISEEDIEKLGHQARLLFDDELKNTQTDEEFMWYVLGIMFAIAFFLSGVPWKVIFTN